VETVVLVLTDVQGSTRLWADAPDAMEVAMRRHHEIVHGAVVEHGGFRPPDQGEGDAVFAAFSSPVAAVSAVAQMQRDLHAEQWPTSHPLRVRVGIHVGPVRVRDGNLFGDPVNRCARIRGLAAGGQTLLSAAVFELVRDQLPPGLGVQDLGEHRMKDLTRPERLHQLDVAGLPREFPPLASLERVRHNLPVQPTPFIGRERELVSLVNSVRHHRVVTVSGFGGMGKTRLALQAAAELAGDPAIGDVWFVDLTSETNHAVVPARVAEAAGVGYDDDPSAALVAAYRDAPVLFVLDNLEHVLDCAGFVADLVARTAGVRVLTTSREALRVRAERVVALVPMRLPDVEHPGPAAALSSYEAVRFFLDRVGAVQPDFTVTAANASAVAAVCAKLEGYPLALELAASRLRMLSIGSLLERLDAALKVLTGGSRDMPHRHQTLRATVAWSFDALGAEEQALLARLSVLPAPADLAMVEAVCGDGLDVFPLLEVLIDRSMVRVHQPDQSSANESRYSLLVAVRDYANEQLELGQARAMRDRHADHITAVISTAGFWDYERARVVGMLLPHIRAALAHLGTSPDQRYVDLVVALEDTLVHHGLAREFEAVAVTALPLAVRPSDNASILLSLASTGARAGEHARTRAAFDAAHASGEPVLIAVGAVLMAYSAQVGPELDAALAAYDRHRGQLSPAARDTCDRDLANSLGHALRYADPIRAERLLRKHLDAKADDGVAQVRLARILSDHGRLAEAKDLLRPTEPPATFNNSVLWERLGDTEQARMALAHGNLTEARTLVEPAFERFVQASEFPLYPGQVLTDLERASDNPRAVIDTVDRALALHGDPASYASETLRWRRGRALLELGRAEAARSDLDAARALLEAEPSQGPRELLGCLAAHALLVHRNDRDHARRLLQLIAEGRGGWVLPHYADHDIAIVKASLTSPQ
jgi:predicted ATPase/class 3 adenylate cyclase/tetratricopeptide (TPR) repeat protein